MEGLTGEREQIITGCKSCLFIESMVFNIHQSYFNTLVYSLKMFNRTPLKMRRKRSEMKWLCEKCPSLGQPGSSQLCDLHVNSFSGHSNTGFVVFFFFFSTSILLGYIWYSGRKYTTFREVQDLVIVSVLFREEWWNGRTLESFVCFSGLV